MKEDAGTTLRLNSASGKRFLIVGVLVCVHVGIGLSSVVQKSPTYDEPAHLTAGYSYCMYDDYRLQPENGNLPQRWFALPVLFGGYEFPVDPVAWQKADVWNLSARFLYASGNDPHSLMFRGRAFAILLSAAVCLTVYFWSTSLFGQTGGLISLLICSFSPTILAHGRLMTSDMCAALFFTVATWFIWKSLHHVTVATTLASAATVSGLAISKASVVLILPVVGLMLIARFAGRRPMRVTMGQSIHVKVVHPLRQIAISVTVAAICTLAAFSTVWLAYGLRYQAAADNAVDRFYKYDSLQQVVDLVDGTPGEVLKWCADHHLLPEAYLYGAAYVAVHRNRSAFFNGDYSESGWRTFFPYCLTVKTPLPVLAMILLGVTGIIMVRRVRSQTDTAEALCGWYDTIPLWSLLAGMWPVFILTSLNIGHRHLLPTYPAMFVLAGGSAVWLSSISASMRLIPKVLLAWCIVESARAYPHYLSYFNQLVPRDRAYEHLVDSSLDWGQDLPGLATWLKEHRSSGNSNVYLAYFGQGDPAYYGIEATPIPVENWTAPFLKELRGGLFCVSATHLMNVYGNVAGPWTPEYEQQYRIVLSAHQQLTQGLTLDLPPPLDQLSPDQLAATCDVLAASRLMAYLRTRVPEDHIGFSILIFRLTDQEIEDAISGPLSRSSLNEKQSGDQ